MPDSTPLSPERQALAAELALGLLEGAERLEAERERLADPAFARAVREFEQMGADWLDELPQETAPVGAWYRIRTAVEDAPGDDPHPAASNDNRAGAWRGAALAASLAAVFFAGMWLVNPRVETVVEPIEAELQPDTLSVAQINGAQADMLLTALYDAETGTLYLRLADVPDPARVPQLWLIGEEGVPRSLGFGQRSAVTAVQLDEDFRRIVEGGGVIAVSLEEPADQPHEAPSDVLGAAPLAPFET